MKLKPHCIMLLLTGGLLSLSAGAQENTAPPANPLVAQQSPNSEAYTQATEDNAGHTITVDVWSSTSSSPSPSSEVEAARVSRNFAAAGLAAAFKMESTERRIESRIRKGFPIDEFWMQNDLAEIDDKLKLAELSVAGDADRAAFHQLKQQGRALRSWSDWLIEQNKRLALTEYYISSSALDNDDRFQNSVSCTRFLVSMLASARLTEDNSCVDVH